MQITPYLFRPSVSGPTLALVLAATAAGADETHARDILRGMSDYLASSQSFSFDYDATLEVVTTENQILGIASSGEVSVARPDRIRATRVGGYSELEMVFDGATFSLLGRRANAYAQLPVSGGLDDLIDTLRDDHGRPLPAADLLVGNPYDALMNEVTDVKDLGVGVVGGRLCDHLAFRTPQVDWQIWIATGEKPYPCRYTITTHTLAQGPQYSVDIRNWQDGADPDPSLFEFTAPDGATGHLIADLPAAASELPDHYKVGDTQ